MAQPHLRPPQDDLEQRRPVWTALSVLFLDTELTEADFEALATVLAESRYTNEELAAIYHAEVYPVCRSNICMDPGFWACFPDGWVEQAILSRGLDATRGSERFQRARGSITWGWGGLQQRFLLRRRRSSQAREPADT